MKKIISVILCLTMFLTLAVPAFAEKNEPSASAVPFLQTENNAEQYPIVFVTGIGQTWSYIKNEDGTPKETRADGSPGYYNLFYADADGLMNSPEAVKAMAKVVFQLLFSFAFDHNFVKTEDAETIIKTLFKYNTIDEKGRLDPAVVTPYYNAPVSRLPQEDRERIFRSIPCQDIISGMEDRVFCYTYSSFSFLYNDADGLDALINDVVFKYCNTDKVVLIPMSMGAAVVNAYLDAYGTKGQVARVVSVVGCWDGSDIMADLIEKNYNPEANELIYNGVISELIGAPWGYLVNLLLRCMPREQLRGIISNVLDAFIDVMVLHTPTMLALVPSDRYRAIRETALAGNDLAYIRVQTDRYFAAQSNLKERFYDLNKNYGVEFYFLSGYNLAFGGSDNSSYSFFGLLDSASKTNSDEIINIESTSPGATAVTAGSAFADSYTATAPVCTNKSHNHISPDRTVDASTCYYPDRSWFFEGQKHELENNNTALALALSIALGRIKSIDDCKDTFPQFNGSRDVKRLVRDYIPALNNYIYLYSADAERAEYVAKAKSALEKAYSMMKCTINNRESDDAVIQDTYDVLCEIGVYEQTEESSSWLDDTFDKVLENMNDTVYNTVGAQGYADLILNLFK